AQVQRRVRVGEQQKDAAEAGHFVQLLSWVRGGALRRQDGPDNFGCGCRGYTRSCGGSGTVHSVLLDESAASTAAELYLRRGLDPAFQGNEMVRIRCIM